MVNYQWLIINYSSPTYPVIYLLFALFINLGTKLEKNF